MPQAVGFFVAGIVGGSAAVGVAAGMIATGLTWVAISAGLSLVSSALMGRPKLGAPRGAREMVVKTTTGPRAIIYGQITCGGTLVFMGTTGPKNQYLDFVIAIAGHQVEAIDGVWIDDTLVTAAEIAGGAAIGGAVGGTGQYRPRDGNPVMWIYKAIGAWGNGACPTPWVLSATDGTGYAEWTTDHIGRSVAYVHIRCRRNQDAFESGPPQSFRFQVRGAKVYDPRLDSTNGGSGSQRYTDATTWTYSNNPALCAADYITGGSLVNDIAPPIRRRGFGASTASVDWSAVIAAANECEEQVLVPKSGGGTEYHNRYACNGAVSPSDDTPDADCLDALLTSMLGQVTYTGGKYYVHAGAYQTPVYTLTETDLAGAVRYVTAQGRAERYNVVRGTRYDADQGAAVEFLSRTDASYQTTDGRALYHDIDLPCTTNEYMAQRIAQTILRRSREQKTLIWPGQMSAAKIAVWETVYVTCGELGLSNKVFRCIERKLNPLGGPEDPFVTLTLREEFSSTYADPLLTDYGTPNVATDPGPTPDMLDEPTALEATSLPGAIEFRWTPGALPIPLGVTFELWEYTAPTPFSSATRVWEGSASTCVISQADVALRYYWVRAVRGPAASDTYPPTTGLGAAAGGISAQYELITKGVGPVHLGTDAFYRESGATAWDTGVYSEEKFGGGAFVSAQPRSTTTYQMIGLSRNPAASSHYSNINGALYAAAGMLHIYQLGTHVWSGGAYTTTTQLSVVYDGLIVRYMVDGVVVYETLTGGGLVLSLDAALYDTGSGWDNVRFGPVATSANNILLTLNPAVVAIACNAAGTPAGGQFPLLVTASATIGSINVFATPPGALSTGVTGSGCAVSNGPTIGSFYVDSMSADSAYAEFTLDVAGGGFQQMKARVSLAKVKNAT